jgi:hypothetical protein
MDKYDFTQYHLPPRQQRDALQELWSMHAETLQALARIESLLQQLLAAHQAAPERPAANPSTPG